MKLDINFAFIDRFLAKRRRAVLSKPILPLTDKEKFELYTKFNKFMESLTPNQKIVLGGVDVSRVVEGASFTEAMNHSFIQKHFKRSEIEALQTYVYKDASAEEISKRFVLDFNELLTKFKSICKGLEK